MTNPKPGDLAIFVRAEGVPEKCVCAGCYGRGYIDMPASQSYDGESGTNPDYYEKKDCPHCHGSGNRRVTLKGWVRVELVLGYDDDGDPISSIRLLMGKHSIIADDGAQMITFIVEALYSNTCPDEIRAQLKVVEDEDRD